MPKYRVYAQLEPTHKQKRAGVHEFIANIPYIKTIEATSASHAFAIAKTITPHPLVEPPIRPKFMENNDAC